MAKYSREKLVGYAETLIFRSWLPSAKLGFIAALIAWPIIVLTSQNSHKGFFVPGELYVWFVIGALGGMFQGWRDRLEAQKILCQVEQEKHLAAIRELVARDAGVATELH
jgi:hypothetical protein